MATLEFPALDAQRSTSISIRSRMTSGDNRILSSLPPDLLDELKPLLKARPVARGEILHEAGSPIEEVCFPLRGAVSLQEPLSEGRAVQVALIGSGGAIGLNAAFGSSTAVNRAVVLSPGRATFVPARRLAALGGDSAVFCRLALKYSDVLLAQVQRTAACGIAHSAEARFCRLLLETADTLGADRIFMTHESIGDLLAVRRSTVTLIARSLKNKGVIKYTRGPITVLDPAALRAVSCACYEAIRNLSQAPL